MTGKKITTIVAVYTAALVLIVAVVSTGVYRQDRWRVYFRYSGAVAPISFYGRVVDQRGEPLAGASVKALISTVNRAYLLGDDSVLREKHLNLVTDAEGRFSVAGEQGRHLRIVSISRSDYQSLPPPDWNYSTVPGDPGPWVYDFDPSNPPTYRYVPDQANPATFPLARIGERLTSQPSRGGGADKPK